MSAFNQSTVDRSNELFRLLTIVLKQFTLGDLQAMHYQYNLAEAGSVLFMANGADMKWLDSIVDKKKAMEHLIEIHKLIFKEVSKR